MRYFFFQRLLLFAAKRSLRSFKSIFITKFRLLYGNSSQLIIAIRLKYPFAVRIQENMSIGISIWQIIEKWHKVFAIQFTTTLNLNKLRWPKLYRIWNKTFLNMRNTMMRTVAVDQMKTRKNKSNQQVNRIQRSRARTKW